MGRAAGMPEGVHAFEIDEYGTSMCGSCRCTSELVPDFLVTLGILTAVLVGSSVFFLGLSSTAGITALCMCSAVACVVVIVFGIFRSPVTAGTAIMWSVVAGILSDELIHMVVPFHMHTSPK